MKIGQKVEIRGKDGLRGEVAFVGTTEFAAGNWVGVILTEPKGKNNGTLKDVTYFTVMQRIRFDHSKTFHIHVISFISTVSR